MGIVVWFDIEQQGTRAACCAPDVGCLCKEQAGASGPICLRCDGHGFVLFASSSDA
jgi:hypothetical protein